MEVVGAALGGELDVRAAVRALGGVVHGGVDAKLFDGLGRRSGQALADGVVNGGAGGNRSVGEEVFVGVEDVAVGGDLAGRIAVEEIVGVDAVHRKAVAGAALAVGEDVLIPEAGVGAGAVEEVGVDAGAQDGELGETAGAERRVVDGQLIENVAVGGVHLIEERSAGDLDSRGHCAGLEVAVDGGGAVALDEDLGVRLRLETFLGNVQGVGAGRQAGDLVGAVSGGGGGLLQVGPEVVSDDFGAWNGRAGGIGYGADDVAEQGLLGQQRSRAGKGQESG